MSKHKEFGISAEEHANLVAAVVAVERSEGKKGSASKALGIAESTLRNRLKKADRLGITADDPVVTAEVEREMELKEKLDAAEARAEFLEKQLEEQTAALERARHASSNVKPVKPKGRKSKLRVVFPDVHGNRMDKAAVAAFLGDIEMLKPDEAIGLGDLLECGGWLSRHDQLYVADVTQTSYEDDIAAASDFLDKVGRVVPKIELLEGNHEKRLEEWCIKATEGYTRDAEWLRRRVAPEYVINLEKRGIPYHKFHLCHDNLGVPGVIKRDRCYFTHGYSTAKHAAYQHLVKSGAPIVYGHTHRADCSYTRTIANGLVAAWCPGTLSEVQPMWRHNAPTGWSQGYLLQWVEEDGEFLTVQVPIDDGRSFLGTVLKNLRM